MDTKKMFYILDFKDKHYCKSLGSVRFVLRN